MITASVLSGRLTRAIVASLTPELLKPQYQGLADRGKLVGHCYVASEALWHMLGGARSTWVPQVIRHEGGTHWYLKNSTTGKIVDLTSSQFRQPVPYKSGRGVGFLTLKPSKRASITLEAAGELAAVHLAGWSDPPSLTAPGGAAARFSDRGVVAMYYLRGFLKACQWLSFGMIVVLAIAGLALAGAAFLGMLTLCGFLVGSSLGQLFTDGVLPNVAGGATAVLSLLAGIGCLYSFAPAYGLTEDEGVNSKL